MHQSDSSLKTFGRARTAGRLAGAVSLFAVLLAGGIAVWPGESDARSCAAHSCRVRLAALRHKAAPAVKKEAVAPGRKASAGPVLSRTEILAADPSSLERIGRHLIVGTEYMATVKTLVERKAIAGIFITDHNVRHRSVAEVKADIDALQAIRAAQGLPPLIITADQEGGAVSRLSPPLKPQPSIARALSKATTEPEREAIVRAYAATQAEELKRIGVTMNFAPVVDLNLSQTRRNDGETQLKARAISADPEFVAKVAGWYCEELAAKGIMCTMKHFPGLGRVGNDTHRSAGVIGATESQLRVRDWVPFQTLMNKPHVATMLAHVRLSEIDKDTPASFSRRVISDVLRDGWQHDGLLITDDFSMGAVTRDKAGVGGAAVQALNAGADLVLVSFADKHLNEVLMQLLKADAAGGIDRAMLKRSVQRIERTVNEARSLASR